MCLGIKDNQLAQTLAASGFRDTTRLALSNTEMASDMFNMNAVNILDALETLNDSLFKLLDDDYKVQADRIKNFRKELYD